MRPRQVLWLPDAEAVSASRSGAKAANLASAAAAGLPVIPGFVLTTDGVAAGLDDAGVLAELATAWRELGGDGDGEGVALVVRSSSTIEDAGSSSMAGRFTSVLDVVGWDAFLAAVRRVVASGDAVRDPEGNARPMAVIVQRQLQTGLGGVLFGVDPVSGDRARLVVEAVASRPDSLVSGTAIADQYVLSRRGRLLERRAARAGTELSPGLRRRLADLAAHAAREFGAPQDVEWAVDDGDQLWLLQTRPVTAVGAADDAQGPLLGPGPVTETFPDPLDPLERDLWIVPLRGGIERALRATGAASDAVLDRSPIVTTVGGWAAVDLGLLGLASGRAPLRSRISPVAIARHLARAWRVGRLRVALPRLAATVVATVDRDLAAVPRLDALTSLQLVDLLGRARQELRVTHTYEVLCGMLLHGNGRGDGRGDDRADDRGNGAGRASAARVALQAVHDGRAAGWSDDEIVRHSPVVLALSPPSLRRAARLPADVPAPLGPVEGVDDLGLRDGLRLRARWVQELCVRATRVLAERLAAEGRLADTAATACLRLDELRALVDGAAAPTDLPERLRQRPGAPLPPAFRLGATGAVRASRAGRAGRAGRTATGLPAGGARVVGEARHRVPPGAPKSGIILVTRHLEPQLAPLLPSLDGLVAETGSALSHLAILAREIGLPTVVAVEGALERFPPGTPLLVDGTTGEVAIVARAWTEGVARPTEGAAA